MNLHLLLVLALCALMAQPVQAQTQDAPADSLVAKKTQPPSDTEAKALRIFAKVAAGTLSSAAFSAAITTALLQRWRAESGESESSGLEGVSAIVGGLFYGITLGFPVGVTLVDPHDSFYMTFLGGILGTVGAVTAIRSLTKINEYVADVLVWPTVFGSPIIGSLYASEKWRKSSQDRRISFGLAPNLKGGLSAVATLRF